MKFPFRKGLLCAAALLPAACGAAPSRDAKKSMSEVKLVIVDPGHYHAALIQGDTYPGVSPQVSVYAPLGPELLDYLNRVSLFNSRKQNPTRWNLDVHTGDGFFERMLRDRSGNVAVFAGRNRVKIDRILQSLQAGYSVLADKPWIINSADMPKLASALDTAESKGLVGYDVMTERYEITSILQKELVNAPEVFGQLGAGSPAEPAIAARSIHHLMKSVSGVPFQRPAWFFNINEAGEGIADVGTHVVDLVQWTAFPNRETDYRRDIQLRAAKRWPTVISKDQFRQVTGEREFPQELGQWVENGEFNYFCNTSVQYAVHGVNAALDILWNWEAPPGTGDVYEAAFRGSKARVEIRQGKSENFRTELYVIPDSAAVQNEVFGALTNKVAALQGSWPGLDFAVASGEAHMLIPDKYRVGHEAHFAQVAKAFFGCLANPKSLPAWEKSNMLAKYYICTKGVELSRGR
jgi:predicted dehydrogenase